MTIIVCDHCGRRILGFTHDTYSIAGGPVLDICAPCQDKPFRSDVAPVRVMLTSITARRTAAEKQEQSDG